MLHGRPPFLPLAACPLLCTLLPARGVVVVEIWTGFLPTAREVLRARRLGAEGSDEKNVNHVQNSLLNM